MPRAWSALLALAIFGAYLALTPPVSGDKDSAEFTLVLALGGVAHPTGYPLFTLLGHGWTMLVHALGATWAYAANSWNALGGGVAMYFLHRLALALVAPAAGLGRGARFGLAALPVALFAFNPVWTYETTLAEVCAWHVAWALGTALYFVGLVRRIDNDADAVPGARGLHAQAALWGLLCGIGAAHHATSVFVILPFSAALVIALERARLWRWTFVPVALAAACVPLSAYGIILWHGSHPAPVQWPWLRPGWDGFLEHVTGRQYVGRLGSFTPSPKQWRFLEWHVWPFLVPGLLLLVAHAWRARERATRALAASALAGTVYAFSYGVPDPSSYFLQPLAFSLVALAPLLGEAIAQGRRAARVAAWALAVGAVVLAVPWLRIGAARTRAYLEFDAFVASMWRSIPFDRAIVFWSDDMYFKLKERQLLDHEKPGIEVVNANVLRTGEPRRQFTARHGFDPVPRRSAAPDAKTAIEAQVNEHSPLPVIHFDPSPGQVLLLRKPGGQIPPP